MSSILAACVLVAATQGGSLHSIERDGLYARSRHATAVLRCPAGTVQALRAGRSESRCRVDRSRPLRRVKCK
jgi:hypothetical protein